MGRMTWEAPAHGTRIIVVELPASVDTGVSDCVHGDILKLIDGIEEVYSYSYVVSDNRGRYVLVNENESGSEPA